jgi:hypothetical protein
MAGFNRVGGVVTSIGRGFGEGGHRHNPTMRWRKCLMVKGFSRAGAIPNNPLDPPRDSVALV